MPRRQANDMRAECLVQCRQGLRADHRGLRGTPTETPCEGPAYFWAPSSQGPWYTITHTPPATEKTTWTLWKNATAPGCTHVALCLLQITPLAAFSLDPVCQHRLDCRPFKEPPRVTHTMRFPALYACHMHRGPGPPERMRCTTKRACISPGTQEGGRILPETGFAARMPRWPDTPPGPSHRSPGQVGHSLKGGPLQVHHEVPHRGIFWLRKRAPFWAHIPAPESADKKVRADSRPSHFCPPIPGPNNGPKKGPTLRPQKQSRGAGRRGARHGSEAPGKRRTTLTPPACRHHVLPALDCLTARRTPSLTNPW